VKCSYTSSMRLSEDISQQVYSPLPNFHSFFAPQLFQTILIIRINLLNRLILTYQGANFYILPYIYLFAPYFSLARASQRYWEGLLWSLVNLLPSFDSSLYTFDKSLFHIFVGIIEKFFVYTVLLPILILSLSRKFRR